MQQPNNPGFRSLWLPKLINSRGNHSEVLGLRRILNKEIAATVRPAESLPNRALPLGNRHESFFRSSSIAAIYDKRHLELSAKKQAWKKRLHP